MFMTNRQSSSKRPIGEANTSDLSMFDDSMCSRPMGVFEAITLVELFRKGINHGLAPITP